MKSEKEIRKHIEVLTSCIEFMNELMEKDPSTRHNNDRVMFLDYMRNTLLWVLDEYPGTPDQFVVAREEKP